ncbi:MAG TPA: response regulator [Candidatus Limnocylindria bacterium]|nr:response regulator [Candidatus Limnocylindria bacterium]
MSGEKILFADDEEQIRKLLSTYLSRQGYEVTVATDGYEALKAVRSSAPDLVITDVMMPNMNGFELTRRLRADHRTARIPVLMLSARKEADEVLKGYSEGADEYVAKPIEMTVLAAKIDVLLKRIKTTAGEMIKRRGRVILFAHGKGGAGATSLAVNAAVALADTKLYRVTVLDMNLEFGNAHMQLDLKPAQTLAQLASLDPAQLDDVVFQQLLLQDRTGVQLVCGTDAPEHAELVTVPLVQQGIDHLRAACDYLIVDTPATFTQQVLAAIDASDAIAVVAQPHVAALKASKDWLDVLDKLSYPRERTLLVVNRTSQGGLETDQVTRFFNRKPDVVVPFTPVFDEAFDRGRPLVALRPDNAAAKVLRDLAAQLTVLAPAGR